MKYVSINGASGWIVLISPHCIQQTIATERFRRVSDKVSQQLELPAGKFDRHTCAADLVLAYVNFDIAKPINLGRSGRRRCASQYSLDPSHQLSNRERFCHII